MTNPIGTSLAEARENLACLMYGQEGTGKTTHALTLKEASYPAVQYVPREDANMALLARTERTTHCPYKGDANYFSINANGKSIENSIWTYETPFPAMAEIAGHLAFYPDKVTIEEVA